MAGEGSVRAHVLVLLLAVLATAGAPTRCDARLACEAVHLTTGLDCSQDLCVPSNITAGTTSCSPERCYCRIDAAGLPGDGFVFRNGTARCFTFDALDKHHYLRVVVRADHEFARVSGYVTSSTGPEDEPRLRWETETGGPPASGGFEAYPISSTESFSLSREEWRRSASEDEGEWEGTWSVCLNATLSAESETETTRVTVSANSSRCPLGERDRVCSGRGSCVKTSWNCGVAPTCSRYVCSCDDFFAGEDCSVRIPGGGGRGPMPGPEEEESGRVVTEMSKLGVQRTQAGPSRVPRTTRRGIPSTRGRMRPSRRGAGLSGWGTMAREGRRKGQMQRPPTPSRSSASLCWLPHSRLRGGG